MLRRVVLSGTAHKVQVQLCIQSELCRVRDVYDFAFFSTLSMIQLSTYLILVHL